jgi:hypothetical protein
MTCQHIHKAVKEQLVFMSGHLKSSNIAWVTGISHCTVNRVIKLKRETGSVVRNPLVIGPRLPLTAEWFGYCSEFAFPPKLSQQLSKAE